MQNKINQSAFRFNLEKPFASVIYSTCSLLLFLLILLLSLSPLSLSFFPVKRPHSSFIFCCPLSLITTNYNRLLLFAFPPLLTSFVISLHHRFFLPDLLPCGHLASSSALLKANWKRAASCSSTSGIKPAFRFRLPFKLRPFA
jgi:hypothetical protein